jgi:assimilatory nitrate reductase catalytic subunit
VSEKTVNTTCGYCATGCNMTVHIKDGAVIKVNANPDYPVNMGKACPKGFQFLGHLNAPDRATTPYLRNSRAELEPVDWHTALKAFTDNLKNIQREYGREAIAFISTGQITTEELAFLGALARFGMGILHGDGNTRQCMATAVAAYKQSFGFDAPPYTYSDFEESDVLVFIGANTAIAHPIMWNRVKMNKKKPAIIVIDPRKTKTASYPTIQHYCLMPKSDLTLLYGIANILIEKNWVDQAYIDKHTTGFEDFKNHVKKFSPDKVSEATELTKERIYRLAETIHNGRRVSFWWTMGVNQSHQGVRTAQAIINLALMTGNIGKAGTGANSITGQCNAMGSRLFSNTTSLLGGYDFSNPAHRGKVADILGIDVKLIPGKPSLPYDRILDRIENGQIKGLWVICTNPVHSWINRNRLMETFKKLEYLVVEDMFYTTETAQLADLILPAAGYGEKDGTFINSERRIGIVQKVSEPPGEALPDFEIFKRIAEYWGSAELFREWISPEAVFHIMKKLSKGQPCDISGIRDYGMIDEYGGIQWPFPENSKSTEKERRLLEDGRYYHPDWRARFVFEDVADVPEKTSDKYPFILLTGRGTVAQWQTLTRTDKAEILKRMSPEDVYIEINPLDAENINIMPDEWVIVSSKRGEIKAKARVCDTVQPGQVFMPMHYYQTNVLTFPAFDPYSRQPAYKYAAVNIRSDERAEQVQKHIGLVGNVESEVYRSV